MKKKRREKVAIVGSQGYPRLDEVRAFVRKLPKGTEVVCRGLGRVDREAIEEARRLKLKVKEFFARGGLFGGDAPFLRNKEIANYADRCVAFWDEFSEGTADVMDCFLYQKKKVRVFLADHERRRRGADKKKRAWRGKLKRGK